MSLVQIPVSLEIRVPAFVGQVHRGLTPKSIRVG